MTNDERAQRWIRVGALAAFSLVLGYAETFVPIPIPGVKLGLANIAVLAAIESGDAVGAACIALIKVLATGLLFGSPVSLAYSAMGTTLSLAAMVPLSRLRTMRLWMTSVVGALLHEVGQLMVAQLILRTSAIWYLLPAMMVAGCATGALCGVWATSLGKAIPDAREFAVPGDLATRLAPHPPSIRTTILTLVTVVFALVVLHASSIVMLLACGACALVSCAAARLSPRDLVRMMPLLMGAAILTLSLHLLTEQGVFGAGPTGAWPTDATREALLEAGRATLCLANLLLASRAFSALVGREHLAGGVAWTLRPLERLGLHTEGFVLAFDVAVRLMPLLAQTLRNERKERLGLKELRQSLPSMIREACLRASQISYAPSEDPARPP